jgi:hypothetical protein
MTPNEFKEIMEETLENLEKAKEFISIVRKYLEECN